ncbi:MAG: histidine phosphatase family protein [Gammaproteobacteria bacterium]|nr:histidine phosphatase family protein [Gammaproteobacteria bacterium]
MQIYVLRHGQTNYNLKALCNGDPKRDVHLTPEGIKQAEVAAEKLKNDSIDLILVSELPRTRQTAEIINRYHQVEIAARSDINDIRSGFEDRSVSEYQSAIARDRLNSKFNDGESLLEHKQRIQGFLGWLQNQNFASVLIVAHEETLRVVDAYFRQLDDETMIDLHFRNCEILRYSIP